MPRKHQKPTQPPKLATLFAKAEKLVYGDRLDQYGDFVEGYSNAIDMFAAWKRGVGNRHSGVAHIESVSDLMMMMVFIKLYREGNKHKEDNITDAIGYLEMYHRAKERETK